MKKIFLALVLFISGGVTVFAGNNLFPDVTSDDWFYDGVEYSTQKGLMNGYENDNFGPNDSVTRAQLATVLERMDAGSINEIYLELQAIRDHDTNQLTGSSWEEYVDSMKRFSISGVIGTGEGKPNHTLMNAIEVVASDKVNGINVATDEPISSNISYFFLEISGMGTTGMYGPFYDNLERIIAEIEGINSNLID